MICLSSGSGRVVSHSRQTLSDRASTACAAGELQNRIKGCLKPMIPIVAFSGRFAQRALHSSGLAERVNIVEAPSLILLAEHYALPRAGADETGNTVLDTVGVWLSVAIVVIGWRTKQPICVGAQDNPAKAQRKSSPHLLLSHGYSAAEGPPFAVSIARAPRGLTSAQWSRKKRGVRMKSIPLFTAVIGPSVSRSNVVSIRRNPCRDGRILEPAGEKAPWSTPLSPGRWRRPAPKAKNYPSLLPSCCTRIVYLSKLRCTRGVRKTDRKAPCNAANRASAGCRQHHAVPQRAGSPFVSFPLIYYTYLARRRWARRIQSVGPPTAAISQDSKTAGLEASSQDNSDPRVGPPLLAGQRYVLCYDHDSSAQG
ncbi:hypothetical protein B0T14DRAFT_120456 [Immersiella caudata]|uniref:Uncharacterized protein n=1 Tax=Immersiella caudata TaxID=314043 RepID=A0AA40C636_9PEZI|nr:hypothetical protein B0T14DRAFT_120456 [Immersiella caudata]